MLDFGPVSVCHSWAQHLDGPCRPVCKGCCQAKWKHGEVRLLVSICFLDTNQSQLFKSGGFHTGSHTGLAGLHLLPLLTCQSVHPTHNTDIFHPLLNFTQVGTPPPFMHPSPLPHKRVYAEGNLGFPPLNPTPLPPHGSPSRPYREATVSVPGVRPSYPGGAAFRSRRWSAWLLSPPRWGNTPLWIPGSFSLLFFFP